MLVGVSTSSTAGEGSTNEVGSTAGVSTGSTSDRRRPTRDELTPREREILALVGRGLSNHEIAEELVLSPLTVKTHVSRLFLKLHARDRAQCVVIAYESGLVVAGT